MPVTIYGIKNCDTMKKARAWLDQHRVAYDFHDYKTAGIERAKLQGWAKKAGWETLLNRAGTTFRKLPDKDKAGLTETKAIALMLDQPSMIKRPVLELSRRQAAGRVQAGNLPRRRARIASPKCPRTIHYRGDGTVMVVGRSLNLRRPVRPEML